MNISGKQSFTLVEVLITVGILSIIVGVGFLNLTGFKSKHSFDLDAENVVASIRNTQNRALLGEGGTSWGIRFVGSASGGSYQIFSGVEYAPSSVVLSDSLSASSRFYNPSDGFTKTIIFSPISGLPTHADTVVLGRSSGNDLYILSINALGRVSVSYETGLVGYWSFDEGLGTEVRDGSLYGNNGSLVNDPVWKSDCKSNTCLEFDGIEEYITFIGPVVGANDLTVSFWMNPDTLAAETILGTTSTYTREVQIQDSDTLEMNLGEGSVHNYFDISSPFQTNQWQHVVVTKNTAGDVRVYLNGQDVTVGTPTISNTVDFSWNLIGSEKLNVYFDGELDEIRIYDRVLTAEQVEQLYESY